MPYIGADAQGIIASIDGGTISNATLDSSVTFPAGTVLQWTRTSSVETNSIDNSQWHNILETSITAKSSSSKIYVFGIANPCSLVSDSGGGLRIYKNTSSSVSSSHTLISQTGPAGAGGGVFMTYVATGSIYIPLIAAGADTSSHTAGDTIYYAMLAKAYNANSISVPTSASTNGSLYLDLVEIED